MSQGAMDAGATHAGMAKIVPDNLFAFLPSMAVIGKEREYMSMDGR